VLAPHDLEPAASLDEARFTKLRELLIELNQVAAPEASDDALG
jgi:hypothetical protein